MLAFLLIMLAGIPLAIFRGYVLSILWDWFLVPLGLPTIGIAHAIGLTYIVTYLTYHYRRPVPAPAGEKWWQLPVATQITTWLIALMTWGFAAIVHAFM